MVTGSGGRAGRALAVIVALAMPTTAYAHTVLIDPPPRDVGVTGNDAHKTGPCGGVARTTKVVQYDAGAQIQVQWKETIAHQGCYQVGLSTTGSDTNFTTLAQLDDDAGGAGTTTTAKVQLPSGVTCANCTLVVRQLMLPANSPVCPTNANPELFSTYYSCADIRIGDFADASAPEPSGDAGTGTGTDAGSGGPSSSVDAGGTSPSGDDDDDGSAPNLRSGAGGDGCSVAWGATSGISAFVTVGLLGLAVLRRRRRS